MTSTETAPDVRLENVVKRFDEAVAVDGISVEIPRGLLLRDCLARPAAGRPRRCG